ncbi:MAG: helix-turn-helix transcriptional regulator [Thermoanaerobaculia bacterium]
MVTQRTQQVELVGRKIRQLRKERKLTQSDLASRIGIQQSDLSRIERGEYRVSLDILFRMLAEFRVSLTEFFDEKAAGSVGPREVLLVQQLNSLPANDQEEIRNLIAWRSGTPPERREAERRPSPRDR